MNLNSSEIRRLNIKSFFFFNRRCLWRCCRCCLNCILLLEQRASACSFDHLFVRLSSLCLGVCLLCTRLSKHLPAAHLVVIVCAGDIRLLFKLILKFRNVWKHTEKLFTCNQNIKESISTALKVFLSALKRNETKHKQIPYENIHATRE